MLNIGVLWVQISLCLLGIWATYYIFKLINHGNAWWVMSLGFIILLANNLLSIYFYNSPWYIPMRTIWMPLATRIAFVISVFKILKATEREHKFRVEAESKIKENFSKLRELTEKMEVVCPFWSTSRGCQNPDNPANKLVSK